MQVGSGYSSVSPQFLVKTQACDQMSHPEHVTEETSPAPFSTGPCHRRQAPVVVCTSSLMPSQMGVTALARGPRAHPWPTTRDRTAQHPDPRPPVPGAARKSSPLCKTPTYLCHRSSLLPPREQENMASNIVKGNLNPIPWGLVLVRPSLGSWDPLNCTGSYPY